MIGARDNGPARREQRNLIKMAATPRANLLFAITSLFLSLFIIMLHASIGDFEENVM